MAERILTPDQIVGRAVRALRTASGMTQAELGVQLATLGAHSRWQSGVAALEAGRRRIGFDDLLALARIFAVTPQSLLAIRSHGDDIKIEIGGLTLTIEEWFASMRIGDDDVHALADSSGQPSRRKRHADQLRRLMRKVAEQQREQALANRTKLPGPTFIGDDDVVLMLTLQPFGAQVPLKLRKGKPHVARDELEARALLEAEADGRVRRISRHEARRIRERSSKASSKRR
jgi:transcriptional regulator with XRE-family HTH domain